MQHLGVNGRFGAAAPGPAAVDERQVLAVSYTVGIMALVAQAEREAISRRTKEALTVAKAAARNSATPTAPRRSAGPAKAGRRSGRLWR